jgi:diguanylate cyclase (GGDEF)-like protein/PAS domain S-box-containing protein
VDDAPLSLMLASGDLAIVLLDPDGLVVSWNAGAEGLLGYRAAEIVGRHVSALDPHDEAGAAAAGLWMAQAAVAGSYDSEGFRRRSDGTPLWVNQVTVRLRHRTGAPRGFALVLRDAAERRREQVALRASSAELEELASADPLTGLRNRREFDRVLRTVPRERFTILAIDVDHLKRVNDEYGHQAGDVLLRSIATTLSVLVRGWDVLARLGGDEFAVLLPGARPEEAAGIAERMRVAVRGVPSSTARISVGWASAPAGTAPREVWSTADRHPYAAKRAGRDRVVGGEYAAEPLLASGESHEQVLGEVLAGGALTAVYQPIRDLRDGRVLGYEALARPHGFAPTDSVAMLFHAALRTGRIRELDWRCRRAALAEASRLPEGATLFVNVSTTALLDPVHDADQLLLLLRSEGWPAERTVLELSAHERIPNLGRLGEVLAGYRNEGLRFAFDGAGIGSSTPEVLATVRPEFVKVGRRVTMTASRSTARAAIDETLSFARTTGAVTIAQGVENRLVADQLRTLGVGFGQGFRLGKPGPARAMSSRARRWAA